MWHNLEYGVQNSRLVKGIKQAYLADMSLRINKLDLKLQGQHDNVFWNWKNVFAFEKSLTCTNSKG